MLCLDSEFVGNWVYENLGSVWTPKRGTAIGLLKDGALTAGVVYEDYNGSNVVCHIVGKSRWASITFLSVIFDYPFNQLRVRRITVPVQSVNKKAIKFVLKLGFEYEATLEGATSSGDLLIFRMFRDKCKYIKVPYGKRFKPTSSA